MTMLQGPYIQLKDEDGPPRRNSEDIGGGYNRGDDGMMDLEPLRENRPLSSISSRPESRRTNGVSRPESRQSHITLTSARRVSRINILLLSKLSSVAKTYFI